MKAEDDQLSGHTKVSPSSLLVDRYHDVIALEDICTFGPFPDALKRGPHLGVLCPFPTGRKVNTSGMWIWICSRSRRDFVVEERVEQVHLLLERFVKMANHVSAATRFSRRYRFVIAILTSDQTPTRYR